MVQPHVILPSQHFQPPGKLTPERRLMMAVLDDAIRCVEKYRCSTDARGRRVFFEAKRWLLAEEPNWPYSFERICAVLDLDATAVRYRLLLAPPRQPASASCEMPFATHDRAAVAADISVDAASGIRSRTLPRSPTSGEKVGEIGQHLRAGAAASHASRSARCLNLGHKRGNNEFSQKTTASFR